MIKSFVIVSVNGFEREPDVFPSNIPKLEFFKPEYAPTLYSWIYADQTFVRKIDPIETCSMMVSPDKMSLLVLQNSEKYGSNNLIVLNPTGQEERRIDNPYSFSKEFEQGDDFEFIDIKNQNGMVLAKIAVTRDLPGRTQKAEPIYGTFFDCHTWQCTPLEFIDSRNA